MKLYMVRHGETELNQRGCYYGMTDVSLTDRGREQAALLAKGFEDITFDYVICSPLKRARETAEFILAGRNIPIREDERLCEQNFGCFEGKTYSELLKAYPEELNMWNQDYFHYIIPEGESFEQVRTRTDAFVYDLKKSGEKPNMEYTQLTEKCSGGTAFADGLRGNVLLVAHKGTLGHMMASMLSMPLEGYWNFVFEQGCYNRVDLEDGYAIIRKLNQSVSLAGEDFASMSGE